MKNPKAVCSLIIRNGMALAVSRRNDSSKWGLPGGKVDPGETAMQAVIRETFEEVGFNMDPAFLKEIFTEICLGQVSYEVTTFLYTGPSPDLEDLVAEKGLLVDYKTFDLLKDVETSPFANYNRHIVEMA